MVKHGIIRLENRHPNLHSAWCAADLFSTSYNFAISFAFFTHPTRYDPLSSAKDETTGRKVSLCIYVQSRQYEIRQYGFLCPMVYFLAKNAHRAQNCSKFASTAAMYCSFLERNKLKTVITTLSLQPENQVVKMPLDQLMSETAGPFLISGTAHGGTAHYGRLSI